MMSISQAILSNYTPPICSANAIPFPKVFGTELISLDAQVVPNYSRNLPRGTYANHGGLNVSDVTFCNVSLSYTHPGQNDDIHVQVWLPMDTWNGRMLGVGGSGWTAGLYYYSFWSMAGAIGQGYATVSTDAGIHNTDGAIANDLADWALNSPGNVNLYNLENLASVSLNDSAFIGKGIVESFYGVPPTYSYWSGCSQGGRQGFMLAQRYPTAYDGIVASAPAIDFEKLPAAGYYPQLVMNEAGVYPFPCEFSAITSAAISACDGLDGVEDGIVSNPEACKFDATSLIGTKIDCKDVGRSIEISATAAKVANAAWNGPQNSNGDSLWFGIEKETPLVGDGPSYLAQTTCQSNGTCVGAPNSISIDWIKYFVQKDPNFRPETLNQKGFDRVFHQSLKYSSTVGTTDPDLSEFRERGGKLLSYHGLADTIIPPKVSQNYYDSVSELDPSVQDFYRLFLAPGLGHCFLGTGPYPDGIFDAMVDWVEHGVAPEDLHATAIKPDGSKIERPLCPYPKVQTYRGHGDPNVEESFHCI